MTTSPAAKRPATWCLAAVLGLCAAPAAAQLAPGGGTPLLRGTLGAETQVEDEAQVDLSIEEAGAEMAELPEEMPRRMIAEEEPPYAPLGIRLGAFLIYPAVEAFLGHASNVFSSSTAPEPGTYYRVAPEIEAQSDWTRHSLRGFAALEHESFFEQSGETTTALDTEIEGRLDISARDVAGLRLAYAIVPEGRGDPNVPQSVVEPPDSEEAVAEATYAHRFGRVEVSLRGAAAEFTYDNALLADGTVVDNTDRDYRELSGALRASIDLADGSRAVFVEAGANDRTYRRAFDANGVRRGSHGYDMLVGMSFDGGGPLSGEVAVGYQRQIPVDPMLPDIDSVAFQGALVWRPTGLTTFTFEGAIEPEESTLVPTASGALVYTASIGVEHALRRNLIAAAGFAFEQSDYIGSNRFERDYLVTAGIEYMTSRWLSFQLDASYERFESNFPGDDYEDTRIEVGVRLQR